MDRAPPPPDVARIRRALLGLDGRSLLAELGALAPLPESGVAAGQSVSTLAMARLGILADGPMNDVDVFMGALSCPRAADLALDAERTAGSRLGALSSRVSSSSFAPWDNRYAVMMDVVVKDGYSVLATARQGMLNEVVYERFAQDFSPRRSMEDPVQEALAVIRAFDLNCAQVGVDIATGALVWTPAFEEFLATFELRVRTVATPHHTATRYFKKKNALGCGGDDELAMATCALPGLLGLHQNISKVDPRLAQSVACYGSKAHADYQEVRAQISPWFEEVREPTRAGMWRLRPVFEGRRHVLDALAATHTRLEDLAAGGIIPQDGAPPGRPGPTLAPIYTSPEIILPRAAHFVENTLRTRPPEVQRMRASLAHALDAEGAGWRACSIAATMAAAEPSTMASGPEASPEEARAYVRMAESNSFMLHMAGEMGLAELGRAALLAEELAAEHGPRAWKWLACFCEEPFAPRMLRNPHALRAYAAEMAALPDWTQDYASVPQGRAAAIQSAAAIMLAVEQRQAILDELGPEAPAPARPRRRSI